MSDFKTVHTTCAATRRGGLHQILAVAAPDADSARRAFEEYLSGHEMANEDEEYRMAVSFHDDRDLPKPDRDDYRYECGDIESYEPDEDGDYPDRRFEEAADEPGTVVLIESGGNG